MVILRPQNFVASTDSNGTRAVTFGDKPLNPRTDIRNHSPDGFNWGYGGSGPAQLALALLAAALGDDAAAEGLYQDYKWEFVSKITVDNWTLPVTEVLAWVEGRPEREKWLNRN